MNNRSLWLLASLVAGVSGCSSSDSTTDSGDSSTSSSILNTAHFRSLTSATTNTCELEDGSDTTCHVLTFAANVVTDSDSGSGISYDVSDGPFCPENTSETGGMAIYTPSGGAQTIYAINGSFISTTLANDGFDAVDDVTSMGTDLVCIVDLTTFTNGADAQCDTVCSDISAGTGVTLTYYIPVVPQTATTPSSINQATTMGLSLDGVAIAGAPPAIEFPEAGVDAAIPALDPCGGHQDPGGYFHWHFVPDSVDKVLTNSGVNSSVDCTLTQNSQILAGYALDGYPMYGDLESDGSTPSGLDSCGGHVGNTTEFPVETHPDGVYHYHASTTADEISIPDCLTGKTADVSFEYSSSSGGGGGGGTPPGG